MRVIVGGVGYRNLRDHSVGVAITDRLETVGWADDVVVEDLNLRGFWLDGVNCHDNVRRTDLVRITAKDNGRSGISIGGSSRVRIETCTAAGNGQAQVRIEGYSIVEMIDNTLDDATAPAVVQEGGRIVKDR